MCGHESMNMSSNKEAEDYGKCHKDSAHGNKAESRWNDFYSVWKHSLATVTFTQLKEIAYYPTLKATYEAAYNAGYNDAQNKTKA